VGGNVNARHSVGGVYSQKVKRLDNPTQPLQPCVLRASC